MERKSWQHTCSGLYIRTMDSVMCKHRWTRYLLIHCSRLSILAGTSLLPTHQHDIYITRPVHSPSMGPHRLYWWWQIRKIMFNIRLRNRHYFMNPLQARNRCIVQIFHTRPYTTPIQIHGNLFICLKDILHNFRIHNRTGIMVRYECNASKAECFEGQRAIQFSTRRCSGRNR